LIAPIAHDHRLPDRAGHQPRRPFGLADPEGSGRRRACQTRERSRVTSLLIFGTMQHRVRVQRVPNACSMVPAGNLTRSSYEMPAKDQLPETNPKGGGQAHPSIMKVPVHPAGR